jgi:hypothetical protein
VALPCRTWPMAHPSDLPPKFHPAASCVLSVDTPEGAAGQGFGGVSKTQLAIQSAIAIVLGSRFRKGPRRPTGHARKLDAVRRAAGAAIRTRANSDEHFAPWDLKGSDAGMESVAFKRPGASKDREP